MKIKTKLALAAVLAALALTAAACGGSTDTTQQADVQEPAPDAELPVIEDSGGLPLADPDTVPDTAPEGLCAPGEPLCDDTPGADAEVNDLPQTTAGMAVDGGLTISEALAGETTGVLAVKGHLYDEGTGTQLCEALVGLGERYGCEGALIPVENLDVDSLGAAVIIHDGLTYTEEPLTLFGELVDGTLIVDNLITG